MVEHEVTGLVAPKGDSDTLCSYLDRLLGDDEFRRTLGVNVREFAKEHWDMDQAVDRIINIYQTITDTRSDVE